MNERNEWGLPIPDEPGYLPRDRELKLPIQLLDDEPTAEMSKAIVTAIVVLCVLALAAALSPAFWANF